VGAAGKQMDEIVNAVAQVTESIRSISNATVGQRDSVAQIGKAVQQVDHLTQENAGLVEEAATTAGMLRQQANDLVALVAQFRMERTAPTQNAGLARRAA
jgi:methyl-accepting chemotaxis protein